MIKGGGRKDRSLRNRFCFILTWKGLKQRPIVLFEDPSLVSLTSFNIDEIAVSPRQSISLIQSTLLCTPFTDKVLISGCPSSRDVSKVLVERILCNLTYAALSVEFSI